MKSFKQDLSLFYSLNDVVYTLSKMLIPNLMGYTYFDLWFWYLEV